MNVVITGPTGVVGMALIKKHIEQKDHILAICHPTSQGIKHIPADPLVRIIEADLSEIKDISYAEEKYDTFYHLAWAGTTGRDREDEELQEKNVAAALEAVRLAKRLGCKTFVGAGSQAEYGRSEERLTPQTPTNPENAYGRAKLTAGQLSRKECEKLGLRHIWVRILSVYGPYGKGNDVISKTIDSVLKGETAKFTPAEQIWDFLYSEDAAEALSLLAKKGKSGKVYVLGSSKEERLKEYIMRLSRVVERREGISPKLDFGAIPYGEKQVMDLRADIGELTADTGFEPTFSFEEGIEKTMNYILQSK